MLCVYAAVAQAAVRHPVTPFFLLAFVVLASMVYRLRRVPVYRGECWWPRDRLRAFLQVFLI